MVPGDEANNIILISPSMLIESLYTLLALSVPDPHSFVITARHYQTTVRTELCTPNPITVAGQCELKLLSIHSPYLRKKNIITVDT